MGFVRLGWNRSVLQCEKKLRCTFARFSKSHFNNFREIYSSKLVPPIWRNLLGSWLQEAVISGYIKKRTLGAVGRGSGWVTRCAHESAFYV